MTGGASGVTAVMEDYLKTVYAIAERGPDPRVTTSRIAERLGLSPSSASGMVRRLAEMGLVEHQRYGEVTLTDEGWGVAVAVLRRHRLLEMYLATELGLGWDEVHDEAERLEHVVSSRLIERMDARLGNPAFDPHGDPIPQPDGSVPRWVGRRLSEVPTGTAGRLVRVDDTDPTMLRHLAEAGIGLGDAVEVMERRPFDGPFVVRVGPPGEATQHDVGPALAEAMWVAD
jgi:DtxR family Mn-dependent transcriptional regulator